VVIQDVVSGEYPGVLAEPGMLRRSIALHGVTVQIVAPFEPFAAPLALLFAGYPPASNGAAPDFCVSVRHSEQFGTWEVMVDDVSLGPAFAAETVARQVEWACADEMLRRMSGFVHVHAAIVATSDQSMLIVGQSGQGKSTTAVGLAQAGLTLYTDDVALIERQTLCPRSFPRPIKLDDNSRTLLEQSGLVIPQESRIGESVDRTVIPGLARAALPGPPVTKAVFLSVNRGSRPELHSLTSAEALLRTVSQSVTERFTDSGPTTSVLTLVNALQCYELVVGDFQETVCLLGTLARNHQAGSPG
jgi:hypothetical protein